MPRNGKLTVRFGAVQKALGSVLQLLQMGSRNTKLAIEIKNGNTLLSIKTPLTYLARSQLSMGYQKYINYFQMQFVTPLCVCFDTTVCV